MGVAQVGEHGFTRREDQARSADRD